MAHFDYLVPMQIAQGFLPVDMSLGANDGDWVNLASGYPHCLVTLFKDPGTVAEDPTLTLEQATSAAGAGAKALNFTRIYSKQGATDLLAVADFTEIIQAAAATYTHGTSGEDAAIWCVPINLDMLDRAGGFKFIRGRVADTGATAGCMGSLLYIFDERQRGRSKAHASVIA